MIALEVSSAAGSGYGGVPGAIRNLTGALLELDPETPYAFCARLSRWRKGQVLRSSAPNVQSRVLVDPCNGWILHDARLLHSMGIFLPRTPRIPKLLTVHDLNAVRNTQWVSARWHERRSGRIQEAVERADHVVTYSAFTAREIGEQYRLPHSRVHPVPLGVDTQRFRSPGDVRLARVREEHGDFALSIGLLTPRKNFPRLIEAIAALPDLRLVLVGRPSDGAEAVQSAIERHGMRERVTLLRGVEPDDLVALMAAARVVAVPSLYEGFGLTVLEAMACGTPVVCSDAASLPEVAADAACMVDAQSTEALREGIRKVVEDTELASALRTRGLERARHMSWTRAARTLRQLYRDVAGV